MAKFRVTSGDFQVVVHEETPRRAGDLAIRLHDQSNHAGNLGEMTMVEELDDLSKPIHGQDSFISTHHLIKENTEGLGESTGQYVKIN